MSGGTFPSQPLHVVFQIYFLEADLHKTDTKCSSVFAAGVTAEEENVVATTAPPVEPEANVRGDMVPQTPEAPGEKL